MDRRRMVSGVGALVAVAMLAIPGAAWALTSVEGAVIGDQGFYWVTPAEVWIFPHRLGNPEEFAALALHMVENPYLNGEVVRLDASLRMAPK